MELELQITFNPTNDLIDITLNFNNTNKNENAPNHILVPRKYYKAFATALWTTGQKMQIDDIDIGFIDEGGENND